MSKVKFYKNNPTDKIWWVDDGKIGTNAISFDKKTILHLYRDYPHKFSREQVELFQKENPYWADYFSDRTPVFAEKKGSRKE